MTTHSRTRPVGVTAYYLGRASCRNHSGTGACAMTVTIIAQGVRPPSFPG
jgi:hypothetical protein